MWWFWLWIVFVVALLLLPLGYGWGYRGWGPPYPSRYRRRRAPLCGASRPAPIEPGWGWGADFVWVVLFIALTWLILALVWGCARLPISGEPSLPRDEPGPRGAVAR